MEEIYKSKYNREKPIREFEVNQTLYDAVMNTNLNNMHYNYSNYMGVSRNYLYLKKEADKLATALKRDGITEGDKVGVCLITVPEVDSILLGINKLGAQSCWMDVSVSSEEILKYVLDNNIRELFVSAPILPKINEIIDKTNIQRVIVVNPINYLLCGLSKFKKYNDDKYIDYSAFINLINDRTMLSAKYDKERPTLAVQSSGSTGKSKTIIHTDYNFNAEVLKMAYTDLPFYEKKKAFVCAPPWVIYGLVNSIYSGLLLGIETIFSVIPKDDMLYKNIGKYNIVYGVPVYYRYLYDKMNELENSDLEKDKRELDKIKRQLEKCNVFISGGAPLIEEEAIKWQQKFNTPIINGYGNNELVGAAIVSPLYANRLGSIGVPMYGVNVRVFDDNDIMLGNGELGNLYINTDTIFKEYFNNPEETKKNKKLIDGKEWVVTGDLGIIDCDGYVYSKGRSRRLIFDKLGYKISPETIESFIQSLEYVKVCTVVGKKIGQDQYVPYAFVELEDEYTNNTEVLDLIKEECQKKLKYYEVPETIKELEKIPHKDNGGKVDYLLLEEMANNEEYVKVLK